MNVFKIEKMDREQLLQICKIMNIKASKKHTKAQLITKLLKPLGRKYMMKRFGVAAAFTYYLLSGGPGNRDGVCFLQGKDQAITRSVANQTGIPDCISENLKYLPKAGKDGNGIYFQQLPEGVTEKYKVSGDGTTISFMRCDNDLLKGTCNKTNVKINDPPTKEEIENARKKAIELRNDQYDELNRQWLYDLTGSRRS